MTRDDVFEVLTHPLQHEWTVQGFGMLRTYFGDGTRLQVWDQRLAVFGASAIHDHPWDFTSTVMAGTLYNQRYTLGDEWWAEAKPFKQVLIQPGEGGGPVEAPRPVWLVPDFIEVYSMGESYSQTADELHQTRYLPGTVTVIERQRVRDKDVALSIFTGDEWVSAEPRPATEHEILWVTDSALEAWWSPAAFGYLAA